MINELQNINNAPFKEKLIKTLISCVMKTKIKLGVGLYPV